MIETIIKYIAGTGVAKKIVGVKDWMKHKKVYTLGLLTIAEGVAGLWDKLSSMGDLASLIELASNLLQDPDVKHITLGLAMMAGRAAIAKAADSKKQ